MRSPLRPCSTMHLQVRIAASTEPAERAGCNSPLYAQCDNRGWHSRCGVRTCARGHHPPATNALMHCPIATVRRRCKSTVDSLDLDRAWGCHTRGEGVEAPSVQAPTLTRRWNARWSADCLLRWWWTETAAAQPPRWARWRSWRAHSPCAATPPPPSACSVSWGSAATRVRPLPPPPPNPLAIQQGPGDRVLANPTAHAPLLLYLEVCHLTHHMSDNAASEVLCCHDDGGGCRSWTLCDWQLFVECADEEVAAAAVRGLAALLPDPLGDVALAAASHAVAKPLWQQRAFTQASGVASPRGPCCVPPLAGNVDWGICTACHMVVSEHKYSGRV